MIVNNYLEAFLTVYGWELYYILYLMMGSIGLFLYPLARIANDIFVSYIGSNEYAGSNYVKQFILQICLAGLVFWIALVPIVDIELKETRIKSVCVEKKVENINQKPDGDTYFKNIETKVPVMPWVAMLIGKGLGGVIYNKTPCALDVTELQKAMMNVDIVEDGEESQALKKEMERFVSECHNEAVGLANAVLENQYGTDAKEVLENAIKNYIDSSDNKDLTAKQVLNNYDSDIIHDYFYNNSISPLLNIEETKTIPGLMSKDPVPHMAPEWVFDGSELQRYKGDGRVACDNWWAMPSPKSESLRERLLGSLEASVVAQVGNDLGIAACSPDIRYSIRDGGNGTSQFSTAKAEQCVTAIQNQAYSADTDQFYTRLLNEYQGQGVTDDTISTSDNVKLGALVAAGIGGTILAKLTGIDLTGGAVGQITSFYVTLYLFKLLLTYMIPLILMTIYLFWGIYMTIGEFRGMVMIKGMILIIMLTMIPAIWAVIEHLDDKLYDAMYGGFRATDPFNMILLDIATGVFQIAILFILFYLVGEAGGGSGSGAVQPSQKGMSSAASAGGSIGGKSVNNIGKGFFGKPNGGTSLASKGWGGLKGGASKSWGAIKNRIGK